MNDIESGRKYPVHSPLVERHNEPTIVFLTVCSKDRKQIFASTDVPDVLVNAWTEAKSWLVGRYVIMPDHIHLFLRSGRQPGRAFGSMGALLEKSGIEKLAASK